MRGPKEDTSEIWAAGGAIARGQYLVGLTTVRYGGTAKLTVDIEDATQSDGDWTPMGDFAFEVPSGQLIVWCPELVDMGKAPTVPVSPGRYVGRGMSKNTESVTDEMDAEGQDEYRIVLSLAR